ncbi:ATPase, V1 complex, subunit H [Neoconidiobolus thromboides FSU 785]|nr:ATPase, V1 complex, subunit H [Neoconidiobolus thromboides FSU 785]
MADTVPSVPVTFVVNSFFDELTFNIRSRPMPWEGYQRASLITEEELGLLRKSEKGSSKEYINLLLNLLNKLVRVDTLQYILVLIDDILEADPNNAKTFHELSQENPLFPYEPFLKCLKKDDDFLALKAEKIVAFLICTSTTAIPEQCDEFLDVIISQLSSQTPNIADISVQLLQSLLKNYTYRNVFFHKARGVPNLIALIQKEKTNPQLQYQVVFCFWMLTFEEEIAKEIDHQHSIISLLVKLARGTVKEKIVRVIIGTFRNLLEKGSEENINSMLAHKLFDLIENLTSRKWADLEIKEDLDYLKSELQEVVASLTTFDAYKAEIETGELEWSPPHKSIQFWTDNIHKFEEGDYALLKKLCEILNTATDPLVLSIAAFDIGQYAKFNNKGRGLLEKLGAKHRVMELMAHENPDVKYQALVAVQILLKNSWDKN